MCVCSAIMLEVAHFASLRDISRDVIVLSSENGVTWSQQQIATDDNVTKFLANNFDSKHFINTFIVYTYLLTYMPGRRT